jgi:glutaredoxin-related protein
MPDRRPPPPPRTDRVEATMGSFHADFVEEVRTAVATHDVVVVGMAQNPHVKRARRALDEAGIPFHYIEHGSYLSGWQRRLAIKLWTGWPTFPQVFVKGTLIGGANDVEKSLADKSLQTRLATAAAAAS